MAAQEAAQLIAFATQNLVADTASLKNEDEVH
jgi:hypothetical protein